jgi:hypothetical protein
MFKKRGCLKRAASLFYSIKCIGMKVFILLFRMNLSDSELQPTKQQMEMYMQQWNCWTNEISENGQLSGGNHLSKQGRVLKSKNQILATPYIADNNSVAGYIIVLAENLDEATKIAQKCPILQGENTSVEIREIDNKR